MNPYGRKIIGAGILIGAALLAACGGDRAETTASATTTDTAPLIGSRGAALHAPAANSTAAAASATATALNGTQMPVHTTPVTTTPIIPVSPVSPVSPTPPPSGSGVHNLTLTWSAPTDNADGTPLTDLTGYKIRYGTASGNYSQKLILANPGLNRYVVDNLGSGTYFFTISAYNQAGTESQLSSELATTIAD